MIHGKIFVDNFAGGGGASTGIEVATGKSVDIAINHDKEAVRMHQTNHPNTKHYCEDVWEVDPYEACAGRKVALVWFSPDCKHFSKAKGGTPVSKKIRGLAWVALKWAGTVRPDVIMLENVEEFQTWGPLRAKRDKTGQCLKYTDAFHKKIAVAEKGEILSVEQQVMEPNPNRKGETFKRFISQLEALGYVVEFKELVAADYGTPTMRKRFFMVARSDGKSIVWPEPTHGPRNSEKVNSGLLKPYVSVAKCIDFSLPCPSIFDTSEEIKMKYGTRAVRPLAENTLQRIARGIKKFIIDNQEPFIMQIGQTGFSKDRNKSIHAPLSTIVSKAEHCVIQPYIMKAYGGNYCGSGSDVKEPVHTITAVDHNFLVAPTLIQYHSETSASEVRGQELIEPIMTLDGSNRYGLVCEFLSKYNVGIYKGCGTDANTPLDTTKERMVYCADTLIQMNKGCDGKDLNEPIPTIVAGDGHFAEVRAFLIKYYGKGTGQKLTEPVDTITGNDRFGLVTIKGVDYKIIDVGLRMLTPKELYRCQGFPKDYIIDKDYAGNSYPRVEQVKRCGNAVCPPLAAALVKANLPEYCVAERTPNMQNIQEPSGQIRFA